jgi:hypothetical protein
LSDFQKQVQEQKEKLFENVGRARAKVLAKHAEQERLFWGKVNELAKNNVTTSQISF